MFSNFLKKKVQDIDRTHNSIFEAHFLADHMVPKFFSSELPYAKNPTLNLKILVHFGQKSAFFTLSPIIQSIVSTNTYA